MGQGDVFTGVCLSTGGRGVCLHGVGVCIQRVCLQRILPPGGLPKGGGLRPGGVCVRGGSAWRVCLGAGGSASKGSAYRGGGGQTPFGLHPEEPYGTKKKAGSTHRTEMLSCSHSNLASIKVSLLNTIRQKFELKISRKRPY